MARGTPSSGEPNGPAMEKGCTVHEGVQRIVQLLPRITRGLRRTTPRVDEPPPGLGPRHRSALAQIREGELTVGALASHLGLTLPTVSGVVADLERAGFVRRTPDPKDRRRTLLSVCPERHRCVDRWLEGSSAPVARVLEQLSPEERATFVKAMGLLDLELSSSHPLNRTRPTEH